MANTLVNIIFIKIVRFLCFYFLNILLLWILCNLVDDKYFVFYYFMCDRDKSYLRIINCKLLAKVYMCVFFLLIIFCHFVILSKKLIELNDPAFLK